MEDQGVRTLVGLVSGGIGCGTGVPSWYTKVTATNITLVRAHYVNSCYIV